jgi:hypothetical protein
VSFHGLLGGWLYAIAFMKMNMTMNVGWIKVRNLVITVGTATAFTLLAEEILEDCNIINKINKINKILAYSARKISANPPAPYSILNPETNSDSPSAKSKGVRLVSAKQEIIQTKCKGNVKK